MFCNVCGNELENDSMFCVYCGSVVEQPRPEITAPIPVIATPAPAPTYQPQTQPRYQAQYQPQPVAAATAPAYAAQPVAAAGAPAYATQPAATAGVPAYAAQPKKSSKAPLFAALALVIAAVLAFFGINATSAIADSGAHDTYPINVVVPVEGFDATSSTPIPLSIDGTDIDGKPVHDKILVGESFKQNLAYKQGTYTIAVAGSPIAGDGTIYNFDGCSVQVTIDENGASDATLPTLTVIPVENRTESMVNAAASTLMTFNYNTAKANSFKEIALRAISNYAADQERHASEEAAAAAQAAANQAAAEAEAAARAAEAAEQAAKQNQNQNHNNGPSTNGPSTSNTRPSIPDGTYTFHATYAEYDNNPNSFSGFRLSYEGNSAAHIKLNMPNSPIPCGDYIVRIAMNSDMMVHGKRVTSIDALGNALNTTYKSTGTTYGPMTNNGRATAYTYGDNSTITVTFRQGGITAVTIS